MRVYQLIRVSGWRPTATSAHRTARRKRWDDLERIMRMVSSAIPIITFRYDPYKRKKLTFWVSLFHFLSIWCKNWPFFTPNYMRGSLFQAAGTDEGIRVRIGATELVIEGHWLLAAALLEEEAAELPGHFRIPETIALPVLESVLVQDL